jgi:hypothetical protein
VLIHLQFTAVEQILGLIPETMFTRTSYSPMHKVLNTFVSGLTCDLAGCPALLRQRWVLTEHRSDQPRQCLLADRRFQSVHPVEPGLIGNKTILKLVQPSYLHYIILLTSSAVFCLRLLLQAIVE